MSKILILFGTNQGHTRKVAQYIADVAKNRGHEVEMVQGNKAPDDFSPQGFDAAFIGTSIHMDIHQITVKKLIDARREEFAKMPTAYFCVCLTAYGKRSKDKQQVEKYIREFVDYTNLEPRKTEAFAGALKYPMYNFIKRYVAKLVARRVGADTDTKRELYEYTDWDAVTRFADEFLDSLES